MEEDVTGTNVCNYGYAWDNGGGWRDILENCEKCRNAENVLPRKTCKQIAKMALSCSERGENDTKMR